MTQSIYPSGYCFDKVALENHKSLLLQVAYQKILQLSYMDKFLSDIECKFRNKYKDDLRQGMISRNFDFSDTFRNILQLTEDAHKLETQVPRSVVCPESRWIYMAAELCFKLAVHHHILVKLSLSPLRLPLPPPLHQLYDGR